VKKKHEIINAEKFKDDMVLQDNVFSYSHWGQLIMGTVFSRSAVKGSFYQHYQKLYVHLH